MGRIFSRADICIFNPARQEESGESSAAGMNISRPQYWKRSNGAAHGYYLAKTAKQAHHIHTWLSLIASDDYDAVKPVRRPKSASEYKIHGSGGDFIKKFKTGA